MSEEDQQTVQVNEEGFDEDGAPMLPVDIEDVELGDAEVLGAIAVSNADRHGGVWSLDLRASFAAQAITVAEVDDRLQEGTYALVRVGGADDE